MPTNVNAKWTEGDLEFSGTGKVSFDKLNIKTDGQILANGTQAATIADQAAAAGAAPDKAEYDAFVTAFNALKNACKALGIIAAS
jgi:hypothetical protein